MQKVDYNKKQQIELHTIYYLRRLYVNKIIENREL